MNRKMTLLARGASAAGRAARGLAEASLPAASARVKKPSFDNSDASATPPKPQPDSHKNSRRVRPQKFFMARSSFHLLTPRRRFFLQGEKALPRESSISPTAVSQQIQTRS